MVALCIIPQRITIIMLSMIKINCYLPYWVVVKNQYPFVSRARYVLKRRPSYLCFLLYWDNCGRNWYMWGVVFGMLLRIVLQIFRTSVSQFVSYMYQNKSNTLHILPIIYLLLSSPFLPQSLAIILNTLIHRIIAKLLYSSPYYNAFLYSRSSLNILSKHF